MKEGFSNLLVDGIRLETAWWGPPPEEKPTLIFLHEGLGCVEMWRDFPEELAGATGCGAFAYSRTGYGKSPPCGLPRPLDFMTREGRDFLPRVIRAAGILNHFIVGHSDGGSIGIIHAGGDPSQRLMGLITEAAHVFCEEISVRSIREAARHYKNGDLREKLKKYHGDNVDCAFWGWNRAWLDPDFMNWNIEDCLPGIKVPMLAIQGEEDSYGTLAQLEAIGRGAGSELLILPDTGHCPHFEKRGATIGAMERFLGKIM